MKNIYSLNSFQVAPKDFKLTVTRLDDKSGIEKTAMEEGQNTQEPVLGAEVEQLSELLGIGTDIVVREHDPLGVARAATGENDGRQVIEAAGFAPAHGSVQPRRRSEPGER